MLVFYLYRAKYLSHLSTLTGTHSMGGVNAILI